MLRKNAMYVRQRDRERGRDCQIIPIREDWLIRAIRRRVLGSHYTYSTYDSGPTALHTYV
jgi:hypothetical protein